MLHAEEVERSRIATELHDDTVQVMIASMMAMDRVALVAQKSGSAQLESAVSVARATLEEATDRTRRLMFELRPAVLLRDGLVAAVRVLAQQVGRETGASARVRGAVARYDHSIEELVYRSVQEALANVRKHAQPDSITVTLDEHRGMIRAEICDDGRRVRRRRREVTAAVGPAPRPGRAARAGRGCGRDRRDHLLARQGHVRAPERACRRLRAHGRGPAPDGGRARPLIARALVAGRWREVRVIPVSL